MTYEQCSEHALPLDAVIVHIHEEGAILLADIHRRLAVVGGAVSQEEHKGPMLVTDALKQADEILGLLKHQGFTRVAIVLSESSRWDPAWGELKMLH